MIFQDISQFSNTSDYLALLNGVLIVECFVIFFSMHGIFIHSKVLKYWYSHYGLAAVLADVCIVMIGFIITRFLYPFLFSTFHLVFFVLLALVVQVVHDLSFYMLFSALPRGLNGMIDTFKAYGKEMGGHAILGDSNIIFFSCLAASYMASQSLNMNLINLIVNLYCIPYLIYT
jgi:hypothetical protein